MIYRKIAQKFAGILSSSKKNNSVILVEGARQVGKTTLIRQVLDRLQLSFKEINLEEDRIFCEKIDRCENFDQFDQLVQLELQFKPGNSRVLFIDEAQESQRLGRFVRFMKEKWQNTQVILSGSSMARIFRDDVRYPVGRVMVLHVQPFSFEEFLLAGNENILLDQIQQFISAGKSLSMAHSRLLTLFQQHLEVGGLPEVVTTFFEQGDWKNLKSQLLLGYYSDFKRVFGEEKQVYFMAAFKATAFLLGAPFKNSFVATLMDGGKNQEIITALGRLEAWKMLIKVDQRGLLPENHFHPKRYLFDSGLAKQLREEGASDIHLVKTLDSARRTPLGGLLENFLANVLFASGQAVTGWKKSSSGSEIDFVVKHHSRLVPMECKAALVLKDSHLGGVKDFMKIYKIPLGIVASLAPFEIRKVKEVQFGQGKIVNLPLYLAEYWEEVVDLDIG